MGQKVNPHGLRVGVINGWDSVWYAEKDFGKFLVEDYQLREYLKNKLYASGVSKITIQRTNERVKITIFTAKPGIIIGKNGQAILELTQDVQKHSCQKCVLNIEEIKRPELDSQLVAEDIAKQLENRVTFRRAMKQAMGRSMKGGALGIKASVSGRLGGADIARSEHYHEGTIPLHTLRADIDYGFAEANTTYGKLGVKVWIYKGEVLGGSVWDRTVNHEKPLPARSGGRPDRRDRGDRGERGDRGDRGGRPGFNRGGSSNNNNRGPRTGGGRPGGPNSAPASNRKEGEQ